MLKNVVLFFDDRNIIAYYQQHLRLYFDKTSKI